MTGFIHLKMVSSPLSYLGVLLLSGVRWQDDTMSGLGVGVLRANPHSSSQLTTNPAAFPYHLGIGLWAISQMRWPKAQV